MARLDRLSSANEDRQAVAREQITRQILAAVQVDSAVSQRKLAEDIGIALGSVNWHLKRLINKGFIKLSQVPAKRYLYYLTPQGFEEKARLTGIYLQTSLDIFRQGRDQYSQLLQTCANRGWLNTVLLGDSELAEVAILAALDSPVMVHAVVDPLSERRIRARIPTVASLTDAAELAPNQIIDAYLMTAFSPDQERLEGLATLDRSRLLIPSLIRRF